MKGGDIMLSTILLVFAFVLLAVAAFNVPSQKVSLGWAGLACYILSLLVHGVKF